jgi:hypothetical protein
MHATRVSACHQSVLYFTELGGLYALMVWPDFGALPVLEAALAGLASMPPAGWIDPRAGHDASLNLEGLEAENFGLPSNSTNGLVLR